jgi:hypothetical protein
MQDFLIWPSESFLLGLCAGEYESCIDDGVFFITIVRTRLRPFFPWFPKGALVREEVSKADIPADIRWLDIEQEWRMGLSPTNPDWLYHSNSEGVSRRKILLPDRKSFLDLILDALGPYMAFGIEDLSDFKSPRQYAQVYFSLIDQLCVQSVDLTEITFGKEFRETILRTLEQLATTTGDETLFHIGKLFGQLAHEIDVLLNLYVMDDVQGNTSEPVRVDTLWPFSVGGKTIDELLTIDMVRQNHYADAALRYLRSDHGLFGDSGSDTQPVLSLDGLNLARSYFWIALGEILGVLRVPDQAFWTRDAASAMPRCITFEIDSADRIRQRLDITMRDLSEHSDQAGRPEAAVSSTYQAIEGLCRRVWPEEFPLNTTRLPAMLATKLTSPNELERRFAGIARNLYLTYRNCASHDPDTFSCSVAEAVFFVNGIRTLVDLWQRIRECIGR